MIFVFRKKDSHEGVNRLRLAFFRDNIAFGDRPDKLQRSFCFFRLELRQAVENALERDLDKRLLKVVQRADLQWVFLAILIAV